MLDATKSDGLKNAAFGQSFAQNCGAGGRVTSGFGAFRSKPLAEYRDLWPSLINVR